MFFSPATILSILTHYKYWIIFPIAIVEGPIIIIISGFLAYLGVLNVYLAFCAVVVGDIIGDSLYYLIGRYWRRSNWTRKVAGFLGYGQKSEQFLESHFKNHKIKTLLLGKVSHGLGSSVQIASGIAHVSYLEFLLISIIGTVPKTLVLFTFGFYVGSSYEKWDKYLNRFAFLVLSIVIFWIVYILLNKFKKN